MSYVTCSRRPASLLGPPAVRLGEQVGGQLGAARLRLRALGRQRGRHVPGPQLPHPPGQRAGPALPAPARRPVRPLHDHGLPGAARRPAPGARLLQALHGRATGQGRGWAGGGWLRGVLAREAAVRLALAQDGHDRYYAAIQWRASGVCF